jgi:hypothetical protein
MRYLSFPIHSSMQGRTSRRLTYSVVDSRDWNYHVVVNTSLGRQRVDALAATGSLAGRYPLVLMLCHHRRLRAFLSTVFASGIPAGLGFLWLVFELELSFM